MTVTLSGSLISFPPMMFMEFTPIQNVIGMLGDLYDIEAVTETIDGSLRIVGLRVDKDAPDYFITHVFNDVTRVMRFKVKKVN